MYIEAAIETPMNLTRRQAELCRRPRGAAAYALAAAAARKVAAIRSMTSSARRSSSTGGSGSGTSVG
jgi:hypothetical protein